MMSFLNRYRFAIFMLVTFLLFAFNGLHMNMFNGATIFAMSLADTTNQDSPILNCPEQINFGDIVECAINQPTETNVYNFSANDGDRLQLVLHNNTLPRTALHVEIYQSWDGRRICSGFSSAYTLKIDNCAISTNGEYQVWVYDSDRDETANYRFTLRRLSDLPQNNAIAYNQIVAGAVESEFQISIYPFEGLQDERVQVLMRNETLPLTALNIEIRNTWDYERLGGGCRAFSSATALDIDNCLLPEDGTYQLWVYEQDYDDSAQFHFSLRHLNDLPITSALEYGTIVSGTLSEKFQINVYTFQGIPDENVIVFGWNDTLPRRPLYAEIHNTWDYKRLSGGCQVFSSSAQFDIDNCSLPQADTYQLWIYDYEYDDSLDYRICVTTVGSDCAGDNAPQPTATPTTLTPSTPIPATPTAGPTETVEPTPTLQPTLVPTVAPTASPTSPQAACSTAIVYGETIQCSIDIVGEMNSFRFLGESGDRILAIASKVTESEMWVATHIKDVASGTQLCHNNGIGFIFAEIDNCILPHDGEYELVVRDLRASYTGGYEINLQRLNPVTESMPLEKDTLLTSALSEESDMRFYTYAGQAGERLRITVNELPLHDFNARVEIRDPNEREIVCWAWGVFAAYLNCELPENGEYLIVVRDAFHDSYGEYTIQLTSTVSASPTDETAKPLVIIYAVLDNNLGDIPNTWERLINNTEAGVHEGINVALLIDGPGINDSYAYALMADDNPICPSLQNPTCGDRYVENETFWRMDENTAHPETLRSFIIEANQYYPNSSSTILSLVGHGSGWSANFLPGQPSRWGQQSGQEHEDRVGGLLWDDSPGDGGTSRSISTRMLGYVLTEVSEELGKPFDLLYLDACSMGMAEVAYELRNSANYLLASANTAWASFAYDDLLIATDPEDSGRAIGLDWLAAEAKTLEDEEYPFTLALLDLKKFNELAEGTSVLGSVLMQNLDTNQELIQLAHDQSERFESDYNGSVDDGEDTYVDLRSFINRLGVHFSEQPEMLAATEQVRSALVDVVENRRTGSGHPWLFPQNDWSWNESDGLAIYLPLKNDEVKRNLYTSDNLAWAEATLWDEFLDAFWGNGIQAASLNANELPTCESTRNCEGLAIQIELEAASSSIFLPFVQN